jgi:hypothetical protein
VKRTSENDRRQYPRFPQVLEAQMHSLHPPNSARATQKQVRGRVQNVSEGGLCILTSSPPPVPAFVCCQIEMLEVPVSIPVLMQVRWTCKQEKSGKHYITGLRFVTN